MESLRQDSILEFRPDTLEALRKMYNLDKPERMKEAIDILKEWIKKQDHFTYKEFDEDYLERLIIRSKGLLERAKLKLDKICTIKTLTPQYFGVYNVKQDFEDLYGLRDAIMPKMTSEYYRIFTTKYSYKEYPDDYIVTYCKKTIIIWEYLLRHDYSAGCILILDFSETNVLSMIKILELSVLRHLFEIIMGCYSMRLKEIHIISASKAIGTAVAIFKQLLSKKLGDRMYIHANIESLKNAVEVDVLPEEYGGKEPPLVSLYEKWLDVLSTKEHMDYLKMAHEMKTDESLRKLDQFNDQYLGTPEKWLDVLSSKQHMDYLKKIHEVKTDESRRKLDKFNEHNFGTPGTLRTMVVD